MTRAFWNDEVGGWWAIYRDRIGNWQAACDARGRTIHCATEKLALSVARYRRQRLTIWR